MTGGGTVCVAPSQVPPDLEDHLAAQAVALAMDIRDDVAAAHRAVRVMGRLELEQVCCVLAAMADPTLTFSQMAWWRAVAPGGLGERELQALRSAARGCSSDEIAAGMEIDPSTARSLLRKARVKLNAKTTAEAVAIAARRGLLDPVAAVA